MRIFLSIAGLFIPLTHAQQGGTFASQGPGVSDMWSRICSTLPFCSVGSDAPKLVAERGTAILLPLIVGCAVCVGIYAGIQVMRAQGSSDGIDKAKTTIMHAAIGMVLMLITVSIFRFVIYAVGWFS